MSNILGNEDLLTFFDVSEFGESLTFGSTAVLGIFSNDYIENLDIQGTVPQFICRTADADNIAIDASMTRATVTYLVKIKESDGTGITTLVLEEQ